MDTSTRKNNYLRALPFRSPEEQAAEVERLRGLEDKLAAQSMRLRRWSFYLAGAVGVAIVVAVAMSLLQRSSAPIGANPSLSPTTAAALGAPAKVGAGPASSANPAPGIKLPGSALKDLPSPAKVAPAFPPMAAKPTSELGQKEAFLEALGGLSAAHLYQSYLNIGLLADGVESKAYTMDEAKNTLGVIANFMDLVDAKLCKLSEANLDADDRESLQRVKTVTELLRLQVQTLRAYWASGDEAQASQYHEARKSAWTGLSKVLGLDAE